MAGFGGGAASAKSSKKGGKKATKAPKKTASGPSPRKSWDDFKELVSGGEPRIRVYAQLPDDKWHEVGDVAVAPPGTGAQAAQANKRLILEHAPRVVPALALRAKELVCGVDGADGEPVVLTKQEMPADLVSGFEGEADASKMYKSVGGTTRNSDPTKIIERGMKYGGF